VGIELILIQIALSLCLGDAILDRIRSGGPVPARRVCAQCGRRYERQELGEPVCRCDRG
jgi:hypothetical protein